MSTIKAGQFKDILEAAINSDGKIALPNAVLIDPPEAIQRITYSRYHEHGAYRFRVREFEVPDRGQTHEIGYYPKIFTNHVGMAGQFDGSGVIVSGGKAYKFHMCDHDWDESGANHSRGWHPKRCRKCGVDASIDSGD